MKRSLCLAGFFLLSAVYTAAAEDLFDIKPVADGVYAAISKPAYKVNCNAAIILFDDSVLVVDTFTGTTTRAIRPIRVPGPLAWKSSRRKQPA